MVSTVVKYFGFLLSAISSTVNLRLIYAFRSAIFLIQWNPLLIITPTVFWPEQKVSQSISYGKKPLYTATELIQPDFCGQVVTGLNHCILIFGSK